MNVAAPYADLIPGLEGPVLEVLAGTTRALTGRQIQRLARRGGVPGIAATLARLVATGIVTAEPAGRAVLYRANREHLAWPVVEAALGLRLALLDQLFSTIHAWQVQPEQATLFGSTARGDGDESSDIDILLVRDGKATVAWETQVHDLAEKVRVWTGNEVQIVDVDAATWRRMIKEADPLVASVAADGIDLIAATWRAA